MQAKQRKWVANDHDETNLDTNRNKFFANEQQKVYMAGNYYIHKFDWLRSMLNAIYHSV